MHHSTTDNKDNGQRSKQSGAHVVLLNQAFWPDLVATSQMSKDLADDLVRHGYRVTAVASRSIYGKTGASLPKRETCAVKLDDGSVGHIEIYRVGLNVFGGKGVASRLVDFGLFYLLSTLRVLTLRKPDVVIGFTTPPFIALVPIIARWFRGSKAVYWVMDVYPDVVVACGVLKEKGLLTKVLERISRFIMKRSDAVVVLGRCMRDRLLEKNVPDEQITHIPVWADHDGMDPVPHSDNPIRKQWDLSPDDCCVMYSGNFGIAHEAQTICDAVLSLRDAPNLRFEFVGGGKRRAEVEAFIETNSLSIANYRDYVPRDQLRYSLGAGDVHLISVRTGLEGLIVPSKLFGIMAVGRPALYVGSPDSEIARIITETGCGVVIEEGDPEGLAAAVRVLAADPEKRCAMGDRGRAALLGRFDTSTACAAWRDLLDHLTGERA